MKKKFDICVLGGAGHVGLPLALIFADKGFETLIYDLNVSVMDKISQGIMPFMEEGGEALLNKVLVGGKLTLTNEKKNIADSTILVITIGTPVDEFLNPVFRVMTDLMKPLLEYLNEQTIILRSTVCPGVTDWLAHYLEKHGKKCKVAFCPERVIQGRGIEEIQFLPQIISGTTQEAEDAAALIFNKITKDIVRMKPMEAEFAKLFSNAYRYIQFAISNQFYMLATNAGLDYSRILDGMMYNYFRMESMPSAGFAAGPCLFKDTMQLAAYGNNQFPIGMNAMAINEGLPLFVLDQINQRYQLKGLTVGLLGLAFKPNSDDPRSSLSYKMKKILSFRAKRVITTDPHVISDLDNLPLARVIDDSDLLILCVPHEAYKNLDLKNKPIVDIWNFFGKGAQI
ncbi:MAG TPA: nucleotide sugar dehydrogenase [Gammaproteobacteria bacterium]|nr:nucleotide sugar dehydrogenase [Gammaproteobacteria bacterium]